MLLNVGVSEKLQGCQLPWDHLEGHTEQSSRLQEYLALWLPRLCTTISQYLHCKTGRMWLYAYFASAFPRIKSKRLLQLGTGGGFGEV